MFSLLKILGIFLLIGFLFSACENKKLNTKQIAREIEDRKIKRVTEADLTEAGYEQGEQALKKADSLWKALPEQEKAALIVQDNFEPLEKTLSEQYGAEKIRIIDIKNPQEKLSKEEQTAAEAYAYSLKQKIPLEKNVYAEEEKIVFTTPLMLSEEKDEPYLLYVAFNKKELIKSIKAP